MTLGDITIIITTAIRDHSGCSSRHPHCQIQNVEAASGHGVPKNTTRTTTITTTSTVTAQPGD